MSVSDVKDIAILGALSFGVYHLFLKENSAVGGVKTWFSIPTEEQLNNEGIESPNISPAFQLGYKHGEAIGSWYTNLLSSIATWKGEHGISW